MGIPTASGNLASLEHLIHHITRTPKLTSFVLGNPVVVPLPPLGKAIALPPSNFARVYVFPRALVHYLLENLAEVERIVIAARACNRVDIALAVSDNFNGAHNAKLR